VQASVPPAVASDAASAACTTNTNASDTAAVLGSLLVSHYLLDIPVLILTNLTGALHLRLHFNNIQHQDVDLY